MLTDDCGGHNWPVSGLIREAQGLSVYEKAFLWCVASHQRVMWRNATACARDMGMGRSTFFRVGDALAEKKLVMIHQDPGAPKKTVQYEINIATLEGWVNQSESSFHVPERDLVVPERDLEVPERDSDSPGAGHKREQKGKEKDKGKGVVVDFVNRKATS